MEDSVTIVLNSGDLLSGICGANDGNLKVMEESLGGRIAARGNEIRLEGVDESGVQRFKIMMDNLLSVVRQGETPSLEYVAALAGTCGLREPLDENVTGEDAAYSSTAHSNTAHTYVRDDGDIIRDAVIQIPHGFRRIYPRGRGQAAYIQGMRSCDIAFCVGPAGTGKTYLAVAEALRLVLSKGLRKLVLTRPVVEAGESLGFLPGDLAQKISPYLRPLYDAMESMVPFEVIRRMEENRTIEIAPLAYMRGRSLNDCAVILDEAQNTTKEQMKMFLTRIGMGARAIITGDVTQIDLPRSNESGLLHAVKILRCVEGIHFEFLHTADVVRNPLIKKIIQAYDEKDS